MSQIENRLARLEARINNQRGRIIVCKVRDGHEDADTDLALGDGGISCQPNDLVISVLRRRNLNEPEEFEPHVSSVTNSRK